MATQIVSQAIIRTPDDPAIQLSIVKAEVEKQNAQRTTAQEATLDKIRRDISANTAYMEQVRSSRNRLLAERRDAYKRKQARLTPGRILHMIGRPLLVGWALFWIVGEQIGVWKLDRGSAKRRPPALTPAGYALYFTEGAAVLVFAAYAIATRAIEYIHMING